MRSSRLLLAVSGVLCAALSVEAGAADSAAGASNSQSVLDEIIVTSRKREESLQEAPVSVTAFSAEMMESRSLTSFNQINNYAPNIELNNGRVDGGGSTAQIFIRGVGQEDYSFPNDPGVGVYVDGVYVSRSSGGDFGFLDIERIEVLRGPQGTLYGKNTIGGAVNVVTKKPTGANEGRFSLGYGEFNRVDLSAQYDFSVSDGLAAKLSGMSLSRDGYGRSYIGQELRRENKTAARGQLLWNGRPGFEALLQAEFSKMRGTGSVGAIRRFWPGAVPDLINTYQAPDVVNRLQIPPPLDVFGPAWINRIDETKNFNTGAGVETKDNADIFGTSLALDWDLGDYAVKSITAYRQTEIDVLRDGDNTPYEVFSVGVQEKTKQVSQEFQFSGEAFGGKLPFIVGVYGINETGFNRFRAPLVQGVFEAIGLDLSLLTDTKIDVKSYAVFGEATWFFTDDFGLTLGGRFNRDDKKYTYELKRIFSGATAIPRVTLDESWSTFLPKVGLEYKVTDGVKLYATAAEGFKAGGWNPRTLTPGTEPQSFDPESIRTYEIGAKTTLWDGKATLNVAAFFSEYEDIQLIAVTTVPLAGGGETVDTSIQNAGAGEIKGAELEFNVRPVDALTVNVGLGYLDTKYTELGQDVVDAGTASLDSEFIQSPKISFNSSAEYVFSLSSGSELAWFIDGAYKSKIYRSVQNFEDLITDPYWIFNTRLTFRPNEKNWEVAAYVTNLSDEIYMANGVDVRGLGVTEAYYSRPREWGISFSTRF